MNLKKFLLPIVVILTLASCKNQDEKGSTDTNNTKGSKDYTDSTRKPMVVDSVAVDTSKHSR